MDSDDILASREQDFSHISMEEFENPKNGGNEDNEVKPDYYTILNVPRDASTEDIKAAYKRLSMIYHPDKVLNKEGQNYGYATKKFSQINSAYEDENTRAIYDTAGEEGLQELLKVGNPLKTPAEIRAEFSRVKYMNQKNAVKDLLKTFSADMEVQLECSQIFEDGTNIIDVKEIRLVQSNEIPIDSYTNASVSGVIVSRDMRGGGYVVSSVSRVVSPKGTLEGTFTLGTQSLGSLQYSHRLSIYTNASMKLTWNEWPWRALPSVSATYGSFIGKRTYTSITYNSGNNWDDDTMNDSVTLSVRNSNDLGSVKGSVQVSPVSQALKVKNTQNIDHSLSVYQEVGLSTYEGLFGSVGSSIIMKPNYKYHTSVDVNASGLVVLKSGVTRYTTTLSIPMILSHTFDWKALLFASSFSLLTSLGVLALSKRLKKSRVNIKDTKSKQEAMADVNIMIAHYEKRVETERSKNGLIIIRSLYGSVDVGNPVVSNFCIDVTVPVQIAVVDSRLLLVSGTKSTQLGFYDPCPRDEKILYIEYLYRNIPHRAFFYDDEQVIAPMKSHREM